MAVQGIGRGAPHVKHPKPSPAPAFAYEVPDGFDAASVIRVAVIDQKVLSDMDMKKPMLLSDDGRLVAFHRADSSPVLTLFDLNTFTETARIPCGAPATALAWSQKRLVALFESNGHRYIGVVVPEERRTIKLPWPESDDLSEMAIAWPNATEVVLHRTGARR